MGALRILTNSEMTVARRCMREHRYSYLLGYRAREDAEALRFGTLIHQGLEQVWLGRSIEDVVEAGTRGAVDDFEAARARVLLLGYVERWGGADGWDVVGVERQFATPLRNPETGKPSRTFALSGKMDVLLRGAFVEHKTTSEEIGPGSTYWRRLTLNSQVSTYYAGARSLGQKPDRCVYDVIRKPGQRPSQVALTDEDGVKIVHDANGVRVRIKSGKKWRETADAAQGYVLQTRPESADEYESRLTEEVASDPNKYYQRGEVVRLEADEQEAAFDAWQLARSIRDAELAGRAPRNTDSCVRYGRTCAYFDVCCGVASLDDPLRFERVKNVHPELAVEVAE